jgi:hypothetical protein
MESEKSDTILFFRAPWVSKKGLFGRVIIVAGEDYREMINGYRLRGGAKSILLSMKK